MNLFDLLEEKAERYRNKICAIFPKDNDSIRYKELFEKGNVVANTLDSLGVAQRSRILLLSARTKNGYLNYIGSVFHGSLVLWIDERLNKEEKLKIATKFKTDCVIYDEKYKSFAEEILVRNEIKYSINVERSLVGDGRIIRRDIKPKEPALCLYTSGSTGEPKGIVSTHENVLWGSKSLKVSLELTEEDRLLGVTPFSGTNGQIFTLWTVLYTGGSGVYYQGMFVPFNLFQQVEKYKTTWINATPTYYAIIVKSKILAEDHDLSSLKFVRTSSSPLPRTIQEQFEYTYKVPMVDSLGMSETAGQLFVNGRRSRKKGSVGKEVLIESQIRDNVGNCLNVHQEGEIWVKCEGLMPGYLDDEDATNKVIRGGWFDTGDLGYFDEDGFLFLKGRKKEIAIVGGKNVSLKEVDEVFYAHPKVINAVSIAVEDEISSNKIVSFVIIDQNSGENVGIELQEFFQNTLASYKCPKEIYHVEDFPLGGGGKILRNKVKEYYINGDYHGKQIN
jgi:acyl-coenzyme A synthetase/AMP-(fatty) acid ligase